MNQFAEIISQTLELLQPLSPDKQLLPAEIAQISRPEQHGELCLKNQFLKVAGVGELRSASVSSAKIEIANFLFFPEVSTYTPVYAAEFVSLSEKPIVAVLDAKCLLANVGDKEVTELLQHAKARVAYLSPEAQMSAWYLESRSGNDIFVRSPSLEQLHELMQLHLQIWQGLIRLFSVPQSCTDDLTPIHAQKLQHYKDQHRLNYPGIPLLTRSFGQEWTDNYLKNYLFS
jgi:Ferredoxin-dependent bilin reductase